MASPTFKIRIKNAVSNNDKLISGTITFTKKGAWNIGVGNVSGFPDGATLTTDTGNASSAAYEILADEVLANLQSQLVSRYNVNSILEKYTEDSIVPQSTTENNDTSLISSNDSTSTTGSSTQESITSVNKKTIIPFTPQKDTPTKKIDQSSEMTYRIVEVFPKTIQLNEVSMPAEKNREAQKNEDVASIEYPLIRIKDYILGREEIESVTIDCTEFIPKITLSVIFLNQMFLAKETPNDGDIISIVIRSKNDLFKMIKNDYVITGMHSMPNYTTIQSPVVMTFYGELFIPGLKSQISDMSFEGTSYYALQEYCKIIGLGFASNEKDTDDKQIWLKANMAGDLFINNIVERAYKDERSFFSAWIDVYYCLNFVNINNQLVSNEKEIDIGAYISNIDKNWQHGNNTSEDATVLAPKVFSNFNDMRTSSFFIKTWRPLNRSTNITYQIGTKMVCELFEHYQNAFNLDASKYWTIPVEPTFDENKLKRGYQRFAGPNTFDNSTNDKDLKRANYSYIGLYEKYPWLGVQYTISNPNDNNLKWDGNHHKNYQLAKVKNLINNKELDKMNVIIEVTGNNFNIIRGDKIPVALIRTNVIDNQLINSNTNFNDTIDLFYSGWYLVKGFSLTWSSEHKESITSGFTQEFILTRREWPAPVPVEPIKGI